jgi:hypothetical protein
MAHFSFPGFVYVIALEPQTGLYSCVEGQSQLASVVVVEAEDVAVVKGASFPPGLGLGEVGLSNIKMSSGSSAPGGRNKFGLLSPFPSCGRLAKEFCDDSCGNLSPVTPEVCL